MNNDIRQTAAQILTRHFGRGWDVKYRYAPSLVEGAAANVDELRFACIVLGKRFWSGVLPS